MDKKTKELVEKIKKKKELSEIFEETILLSLEKYLKKNWIDLSKIKKSEEKVIIKEVRSELRNLVGQYSFSLKNRTFLLESSRILDLLKTHSSTNERIPYYNKIIKEINSLKPKSILDLGCGLNPIGLYNFGLDKKTKYIASDINEENLGVVERYFKINSIPGRKFSHDLRIEKKFPSTDICLIFKTLDIIEKDTKIIQFLFKNIKSKFVLVSFATAKLSGRKMLSPRRRWFESFLKHQNLSFKNFSIPNEIFYIIKLKNQTST
jgi:2-polyprenyl-3-methyl-5-hydroxy-6-metoxy-1,4-benzoquinol methylase